MLRKRREETESTKKTASGERLTCRYKPTELLTLSNPEALGIEGIRACLSEIGNLTWLETLGLSDAASAVEIREAYARLAELWNPSSLPAHLSRARGDVEVIAAHIENAYRMLMFAPDMTSTSPRERGDPTKAPTRILRDRHDTVVDMTAPSHEDANRGGEDKAGNRDADAKPTMKVATVRAESRSRDDREK